MASWYLPPMGYRKYLTVPDDDRSDLRMGSLVILGYTLPCLRDGQFGESSVFMRDRHHKSIERVRGKQTFVTIIQTVEQNPSIPKGLFDQPDEIKALLTKPK